MLRALSRLHTQRKQRCNYPRIRATGKPYIARVAAATDSAELYALSLRLRPN